MTAWLASVRSAAEAALALGAGVDVLDVKEPGEGALGAAAPEVIAAVARAAAGRVLVSATTGDRHGEVCELRAAIARTAACGVDIVKLGLFAPEDLTLLERALAAGRPRGADLVAVVMADRWWPEDQLHRLATAGLRGVMLDTADKARGALPEVVPAERLGRFVAGCRRQGLECGLAGRLGLHDIAPLLALGPDYLGFRSALCAAGARAAELDPERLHAVRRLIPRAASQQRGVRQPAAPQPEEPPHEPVA